jgi:hypothetical protein
MAEPVRARRLTDQEGQRLQQIVRRGKHESVRVRRAVIIMASASGTLVPAIARLVAADEDTVRDVIHAFNRDAKLDRIEYVTSRYPDRCFAFDQFGPLSIRPCHGTCWAPRKHPVRLRATCHRTHGIRYFHGCYCVGDDQLWGVTREHKGADHTLAALKSIRAARPGGYRLSSSWTTCRRTRPRRSAAGARRENVELCLTPTSASWANPVEAQSGPLRTFVMGGSDHPDHTVLARRLQDYLRWRNARARHPGVLAAQRRERARIRSEPQQRWGRPESKTA